MELILTDEEKAIESWLAFDDEAVGKMVKSCSIAAVKDEKKHMYFHAAALILCGIAVEVNSTTTEVTVKGLTFKGAPQGNWKVTVERIKEDQ